ncbi:type I-C CRISPR-associated protein Cas8c/Csd1 [Streptococcus sp.]|uniref:type I-C CRISPR-associated protein Cas8c/Csd1 n=1 Tax=Streptococcus sp. TaxID=1306 RepID=UPI00178D2075|nr:type I-C CRISPR-associated protein Cas8c/Csd1 [Streptococcus sp.]HHU65475.1 type I-C CRISPR-associated protein Cas8c/Csd1 [Streptococcus sp.]
MDFFASLLHAYESAEKADLVDSQSQEKNRLLPIYHSSLKSNGKNIISISLDKKGNFIKADFLSDGEIIIYPVTFDSMARSGKDPAPHPLVDKLSYYVFDKNQSQYDSYHNQLKNWIQSCQDEQVKAYLSLIQKFILRSDFLSLILHSLFGEEVKQENLKVVNGKKTLDLSSCFIEFAVDNFIDQSTISVTNYKALHEDYIKYVDTLEGQMVVCNISGRKEPLATKHRGLLGNAKLISVSNNTEMYKGRFKEREDVFTVGTKTSEKIHLMLKFLLENDHTNTWLGGAQYLVNWFDDDLTNDSQLDITIPIIEEVDEWSTIPSTVITERKSVPFYIGETNRQISNSFVRGVKQFNNDSNYYVAIINKTSNGRISLKYYREIAASRLLENLNSWQNDYSWEFSKKGGGYYLKTPSFDEIIKVTYGVDRERFLEIDNDSFRSVQYQQLVTALLDGQEIPLAIVKKLESNLKQRYKYPNHWYQVQQVSLAILHKQNGRNFSPMLNHEIQDRDYLFGRLLAIYELLETQRYKIDGDSQERVTNAERYWTAYTGQPAKMMNHLENKVKPYEEALKLNRPGIFNKLNNERREVIELLSSKFMTKDFNQPLDYKFIFGYYAEKKYFYTKQNKESEE